MAIYRVDWQEPLPPHCRGGVVTIGNFDGVHRGHAALVTEARRQASERGRPTVAVTFDPHPAELLRGTPAVLPLTTLDDRCQLLGDLGADAVLVLNTTRELLEVSAEEFFHRMILERLQAAALVEGTTFGFGRGRAGDANFLVQLGQAHDRPITIVPPLLIDGLVVSSSRVRNAIEGGRIAEAGALLGRSYRLHGQVVVGARRGRTIGFPTANLGYLRTLPPGDGVYAVRAQVGERSFPGAANVGPNPTFADDARKVEVHLLDFQGDLYGQPLAVDFVHRLRDTRRFDQVDALIAQLRSDVERVAQLLGGSVDRPGE